MLDIRGVRGSENIKEKVENFLEEKGCKKKFKVISRTDTRYLLKTDTDKVEVNTKSNRKLIQSKVENLLCE